MRVELLIPILAGAGLGTVGQTLFAHYMPAVVHTGIVLLPSLSGNTVSIETPGWRKNDPVQAVARTPDAASVSDLAWKMRSALTFLRETVLPGQQGISGVKLLFMRPLHDPIIYTRQNDGGWEASVNFMASYAVQNGSL